MMTSTMPLLALRSHGLARSFIRRTELLQDRKVFPQRRPECISSSQKHPPGSCRHRREQHNVTAAGQADLDLSDTARSPSKRLTGLELLQTTFGLLRNALWPVVIAFVLCEAATWVLHRISHRLTNLLATRLLSSVTNEALGNLWWITNDTSIANFETGYQYIVFAVFLTVFPLNILLKTMATGVATLACHQHAESTKRPSMLPSLSKLRGELVNHWANIQMRWLQLWEVECQLAARVIPLSGLSLLVLPLPWTLPRLMSLSATTSLAVINGAPSSDALQQSKRRLWPFWKSLSWPYLALALGGRVLDVVKIAALNVLPLRLQRELPEISIVLVIGLSFVSFAISRVRDLLGLAAYQLTDDPVGSGPLPTKPYQPDQYEAPSQLTR